MQTLKHIVLGIAILGPASFVRAELPPEYTRWDDLRAITHQDTIPQRLGQPVDRIEALADGTFRVQAGTCFLLLTISRQGPMRDGQPRAGLSVFGGLEIGEPRCE